ncbi:hypothetical protein P9847_13315 [Paenibacillus chibensis]|uniref:Uncharacterized protein n=1 Tax=Paenibacillus chibensis TaxID=59846 RepID=A0ABU6PTS7_9BACL|nr:hypothetical protein [Paenibacillus chibensis]
MGKDHIIKSIRSEKVCMTPDGFVADQLNPEQFMECHELFFDKILEIHSSDITSIEGYGEFNEECKTEYGSCKDFLVGTFESKASSPPSCCV